MKVLGFAALIVVLVLGGCGYGGWVLYQHHVSSDLRKLLSAALDPTASNADILIYQREARLALHTAKDRELDEKFERVFALASENCRDESEAFDEKLSASKAQLAQVQIYHDADSSAPISEMAALKDGEKELNAAFDAIAVCQKKLAEDTKPLPRMVNDLRAQLSLPPLKTH